MLWEQRKQEDYFQWENQELISSWVGSDKLKGGE